MGEVASLSAVIDLSVPCTIAVPPPLPPPPRPPHPPPTASSPHALLGARLGLCWYRESCNYLRKKIFRGSTFLRGSLWRVVIICGTTLFSDQTYCASPRVQSRPLRRGIADTEIKVSSTDS